MRSSEGKGLATNNPSSAPSQSSCALASNRLIAPRPAQRGEGGAKRRVRGARLEPSCSTLARLLVAIAFLLLTPALLAQAANVPDAEQLVGAPRGTILSGADLDAQTQAVAGGIRCPVCQGLSIADSPSEMAINMKAQVRQLLARGYTREQIETYFERSYGQFVLLRPKFQGVNGMVWILPVLGLIFGIVAVAMKLRSLEKPQETSDSQPATDPYVARVRDLVRGTK